MMTDKTQNPTTGIRKPFVLAEMTLGKMIGGDFVLKHRNEEL